MERRRERRLGAGGAGEGGSRGGGAATGTALAHTGVEGAGEDCVRGWAREDQAGDVGEGGETKRMGTGGGGAGAHWGGTAGDGGKCGRGEGVPGAGMAGVEGDDWEGMAGGLGTGAEGVDGAFLPLAPERMASVRGAHARHLRVTLPLVSKQPGARHCRTVLQRAMVPPHQLQKFFVVLICALPNGPPHLQMALSTESSVPKGGAGGGTGVPGATFAEGRWEEEEVAG